MKQIVIVPSFKLAWILLLTLICVVAINFVILPYINEYVLNHLFSVALMLLGAMTLEMLRQVLYDNRMKKMQDLV